MDRIQCSVNRVQFHFCLDHYLQTSCRESFFFAQWRGGPLAQTEFLGIRRISFEVLKSPVEFKWKGQILLNSSVFLLLLALIQGSEISSDKKGQGLEFLLAPELSASLGQCRNHDLSSHNVLKAPGTSQYPASMLQRRACHAHCEASILLGWETKMVSPRAHNHKFNVWFFPFPHCTVR